MSDLNRNETLAQPKELLRRAFLEPKSGIIALILSFFTLGLYNLFLWLPYKVSMINALLERKELDSGKMILLIILSFGLLIIYFNYRQAVAIVEIQKKFKSPRTYEYLPIISVLLCVFGLFPIVDFLHHEELVRFFESNAETF